ncbi:acyl-CoA thioesterase [Pararhodobacter sp. CCB-MM2]|uniref:acyl-CoA thioesterase n=1 Tax=Pararhodobacter sp. CCB-MM2 TaxID=1786003 RepID=UPI00082DBE92|nr:acyl-CoA thioesterase [Pararhodobacter sp. CCB-MM2]MCA2011180.1 acyl-CoA thioesterase [Cereibacter sphaeroides]
MTQDPTPSPQGELTLQTVPMPADTNSNGDIFGGWVLSQMDIAGGVAAHKRAKGRTATVAINAMRFHAPVMVGDVFTVYTSVVKTGTTSVTIHVEAWVQREVDAIQIQVTEADFTFVAIEKSGVKRPLPPL